MNDIKFMFGLFPAITYKYVVMGLVVILVFKEKIPIINKIDVRVRLPDEFMRHFRWITPLLVVGMYIWAAIIYLSLRSILIKLGAGD